MLIELARRTTTDPERVRHVEADLSVPGWHEALRDHRPAAGFDAIVSTTALHWLAPGALVELYRTCHDLIRPGGVLFNGDHMPYARSQPALAALSDRLRGAEEQQAFDTGGVEDYAQWHRALRSDRPDLDWREREHRFPTGGGASIECGYTLHVAALTAAGFTEVDTIWQRRDSRVLLAVAGSR